MQKHRKIGNKTKLLGAIETQKLKCSADFPQNKTLFQILSSTLYCSFDRMRRQKIYCKLFIATKKFM